MPYDLVHDSWNYTFPVEHRESARDEQVAGEATQPLLPRRRPSIRGYVAQESFSGAERNAQTLRRDEPAPRPAVCASGTWRLR